MFYDKFVELCQWKGVTPSRAAIESGQLDAARWESYRNLENEAESKADLLQRKEAFMKDIAKKNRQRKKDLR